jgi:hypothetical protein
MKKANTIFLFLLSAIVLLYSCGSEEEGLTDNQVLANEQNSSEDRKIPATELDKSVTISGATKKMGNAPIPSGSVDFQMSYSEQSAQQSIGFDIRFNSTDQDISGAYIQLFDGDGNKVDGYFDVPVTEFKNRTTSEENEFIDIDFESGLSSGTFCYEICLYDSDNNVSQVQEVCVEIEAWGGNSSLVGTWVLNEEQTNSTLFVYNIDTFTCISGDRIPYTHRKDGITDVFDLTFNADGTFGDLVGRTYKDFNQNKSYDSCEVIYDAANFIETNVGNWAYNEKTKELNIIIFEFKDLDTPRTVLYPNGDSYIFRGMVVETIENQMIFTWNQDSNYRIVFDRR